MTENSQDRKVTGEEMTYHLMYNMCSILNAFTANKIKDLIGAPETGDKPSGPLQRDGLS